jgi:DNA-binding GntR family transcriptional regulator
MAPRDGQHVAVVYDKLRAAILAGEVPAGEVSQVALARDLDAGRTPLREALRMLQREGLVVSEPNRRVRVTGLSADDAEQLYVMRTALESAAVRITVPLLDSAAIAELEGLMAQMDHYVRDHDMVGMRAPHRAFHGRLVAHAGERVTREIASLFDHAERYRVAFGASEDRTWDQRRAEHRTILDAVVAKDPAASALRLMEHYGRTAGLIFAGLDPSYEPRGLRIALDAAAPGAGVSLDV